MELEKLDIVYTVYCGLCDNCDELRYSLRSLKNVPHRKVFVIGSKPQWLTKNVEYRHIIQVEDSFSNVNKLLTTACMDKEISEDFIWFNDDFYVIKKIKDIPYYYDKTLSDRVKDIAGSDYAKGLEKASQSLTEAHAGTLNFELHTPIVFNKEKLLKVLEKYPNTPARRSYYCNLNNIKGIQRKDVKLYGNATPTNTTFLSTHGETPEHMEFLANKFSEKSEFED